MSKHLEIDLHIKRDDLAGPSFGGNKARQLEYYFGEALSQDADTILITGAVQSNFTRTAVAIARSLGMEAVVQFEDRVKNGSTCYKNSGNVLLSRLMGAEIEFYPKGDDETGADVALDRKAAQLRSSGKRPFIIHLSEAYPPLGALGYVDAAKAAAVSTTLGDPASPTMSSERPAVASQANVCSGQKSGQSSY